MLVTTVTVDICYNSCTPYILLEHFQQGSLLYVASEPDSCDHSVVC